MIALNRLNPKNTKENLMSALIKRHSHEAVLFVGTVTGVIKLRW